ncbi:MAG: YHYH protein [Rhodoglobus sp.]
MIGMADDGLGRSVGRALGAGALVALLAGCAAGPVEDDQSPTPAPSATVVDDGLPDDAVRLVDGYDYGDRYADGILPVGDEHWSLQAPAVGTVFLCRDNFIPDGQAGAQNRGPWFINGNTEWDITQKPAVQGAVNWEPQLSISVAGGIRTLTTNDLPEHPTGEFPVSESDPVKVYDRNPNSISEQHLEYRLTAQPAYGEPQCMGGESGVMLTGVALFNAFDAGGRDAGAWEVQDDCEGHPQNTGEYHYHTLSSCIQDIGVDTVIGFALDGFPITGPTVAEGNRLTTADLDACHGIVSEYTLDGETVTGYHYVMTQDFPYSVSCFRSQPTRP